MEQAHGLSPREKGKGVGKQAELPMPTDLKCEANVKHNELWHLQDKSLQKIIECEMTHKCVDIRFDFHLFVVSHSRWKKVSDCEIKGLRRMG